MEEWTLWGKMACVLALLLSLGMSIYKKPLYTMGVLEGFVGGFLLKSFLEQPSLISLWFGLLFLLAGAGGMVRSIRIFAYRRSDRKKKFFAFHGSDEEPDSKKWGKGLAAASAALAVVSILMKGLFREYDVFYQFVILLFTGFLLYFGVRNLLFYRIGPLFIVERALLRKGVRDVAMILEPIDYNILEDPSLDLLRSFHIFFEGERDGFSAYTFHLRTLRRMEGKYCEALLCRDIFGSEFILGVPKLDGDYRDPRGSVQNIELEENRRKLYSLSEVGGIWTLFDLFMAVLYHLIPLGVVILAIVGS